MRNRVMAAFVFGLILLLSEPAATAAEDTGSLQPEGWKSSVPLREPKDLNPDPKILEINLEARIERVDIGGGQWAEAWTYDGGLPGPLIRLKVGDRLIVHFTNKLTEPTTVHWHGLRVPIEMDGVPGISQPEVKTGESFTYDFVVNDPGLYWYHPHVMSAQQVGFGLYGALLVDDPNEEVGIVDELVLVLSDIEVDKKGTLGNPETGGSTGMAFGREGNFMLVNGRHRPVLQARAGAPQRWRIVNAAKSRYFKLDLGVGNNLLQIGGDTGMLEYPVDLEMLVLAPGERADVIVTPQAERASELIVLNQLHNRGYGSVEFRPIEELFRIAMADTTPYRVDALPKTKGNVQPLSAEGATPVTLDLYLSQHERDLSFEYGINGKPFWKSTPLRAKLGETQIWTLNNPTPWSHPMHLHGFFFQVLDENGIPAHPLQWKDTVDVPFKSTVKVLVRFEDRPGTWMVHCHILDHAEGGLMTTVHVGDGPVGHHHHSTSK